MASPKFRAGPKVLAAMDRAFVHIGHNRKANDPSREISANDTELRIAIGKKLLNLVSDGVTNPLQLRNLTVQSPILPSPDRGRSMLRTSRKKHEHQEV